MKTAFPMAGVSSAREAQRSRMRFAAGPSWPIGAAIPVSAGIAMLVSP